MTPSIDRIDQQSQAELNIPAKEARQLKKNIYKPVIAQVIRVNKGLAKLDLNIPIARLAYMDMFGDFKSPYLTGFKKQLEQFLIGTNEYRKQYVIIANAMEKAFDDAMKRNNAYLTNNRFYRSLGNEIADIIITNNTKIWIKRFNNYIPQLRDTSNMKGDLEQTGKQIMKDLSDKFAHDIDQLKQSRDVCLLLSRPFLKKLRYHSRHPKIIWDE